MLNYDVAATSPAPPSVVWRLLLDASSWPEWSAVDSLDMARSTGLDPDGVDEVGAVRAFRTGRTVTGERLTGLDEERRFSYEGAFNPAMRDYKADVTLTPTDEGGTHIRWRGTYDTRWVMRWFMGSYMRGFMQRMVDGLAAGAGETARE